MAIRHLGWKLAFAAVGLLAGAEIVTRVVALQRGETFRADFSPQLGMDKLMYKPHPYVGWVLKPGLTRVAEGSKTHTNAFGFRGPELAERKPQGVLRVACLGGSTTWGVGATDDSTTWPEQLAAALTKALPAGGPFARVEAINEGCSAYTLMESFVDFKMRVAPLQPDLVVVYHGINDSRVVALSGFKPDYTHVRGPWIIPVPSSVDVLLGWSELYGWWTKDDRKAPNLYDIVYEKGFGSQRYDATQIEGYATYSRTLLELAALARVDGAEPVFATFGYTHDSPFLKRENWMREYGFQVVDRLNKVTQDVGARTGVPVIDVGGALGGKAELFVDAVHLSDAGNAVIAATLAKGIVDSGLLARLAARGAPSGH